MASFRYEIEHSVQEALAATVTIDGGPVERSLFMVSEAGLSVTVLDLRGVPLTLYAGETGSTTISNPIVADPDTGRIEGWTEAPDYDLVVSGTGVATYTQKVRTSIYTNVKSWGAKGDDTTDDTAAIQAALDSMPHVSNNPAGGTLYFPFGTYKIDGRITQPDRVNITWRGPTDSVANEPAASLSSPARLRFTQSGILSCIDARSNYAFTIIGLAICYDNVDYRGIVIDCAHSGGSDSQHFKISNSSIGGVGSAYNARALISQKNAIFARHDNTYFGKAVSAIRFRECGGNLVKLTSGVASGAATVNVTDTSAYAASGTFLLAPYNKRTMPDTVTYTGKTGTSFTGCSGISMSYLTDDEVFTESGIAYSNSHSIRDCAFARHEYSIMNLGDGTIIDGCSFEGTGGAPPLGLRHQYKNDMLSNGSNIDGATVWINNWSGDAFSAVPDYWYDFGPEGAPRGWVWIANFSSGARLVKFANGGRNHTFISQGMGGDTDFCSDFGPVSVTGTTLLSCDFSGMSNVANAPINNFTTVGNTVVGGSYQGSALANELVGFARGGKIASHIASAPTVTSIHANAGSGATCTVAGGGTAASDLSGRFTLTTGTSPGGATTTLVVFAWFTPYTSSFAPAPEVVLQGKSATAIAQSNNIYANGESATGFNVGQASALTASTAYSFTFHAIG